MRWWHATPDVTISMFFVSLNFLFVLSVMMLWSLMRCNQVWVYTYLREKNYLCLTWWRCCCCFGGEGENLPLSVPSILADRSLSDHVLPGGGRRSGLGLVWRDILALPPMAGENYWITSSASLFPPSCIVRTSTVKKIKEKKRQPSLSLLSLQRYKTSLFMVCCKNRAFFFKLILPQRLLRNYFEYT